MPPPPVPENAIAALTAPFQVGLPILATSRIVDPVEADRLIGEGRCDAVGMTRALITDPDMPRKAREGRFDAVVRCIGCNACIAHYHAGTPIACAQNPRTGRERTLPLPELSADPRRIVVVGAGPAGLAAAAEAAAAGHEVVLLERSRRIGGQVALAGAAPMHEEVARSLRANYERLLAGVDVTAGDRGRRGGDLGARSGRRHRRHRRTSVRARGLSRRRRDGPGLGRPRWTASAWTPGRRRRLGWRCRPASRSPNCSTETATR